MSDYRMVSDVSAVTTPLLRISAFNLCFRVFRISGFSFSAFQIFSMSAFDFLGP